MKMKVGLFIPCYVDALYPEVGVASYKLLKAFGVDVDYPLNQTCCGQPQANAGFESMAVSILNRKNGGNWQIPVKHLVENGKTKK